MISGHYTTLAFNISITLQIHQIVYHKCKKEKENISEPYMAPSTVSSLCMSKYW